VTLLRPRKLARFRVASDTLPNPTSWYPDMEVVMRPNHARIAVRWLPAVIPFVFSVAYTGGVAAQQPQNAEYTAAIRQYTTEPFFLTPLVDYLPASSTVPTPKDVLGHVVGQPDVLHYPEEIYRYMREVEKASPRVKVFSIGETEEGREMLLVVVADEATIANLDQHKANLAKLADPRGTTEEEAQRIIGSAKPIYWATGAIHSPETGSPEMLMELVYRLAVDEGEHIRAIRDNLIFMATPIVEVDGRAKVVDIHMAKHKDPDGNYPRNPLYWGKYVAHDNNRDGMGLQLALTRNVLKTFMEWHPTVLHDLHESASYLYTSTGRGPYNAWVDPIVVNEWNRLAFKEVKDMTAWGVPGIYTFDFYDGWAPNYLFWIANMRNSIGRFYETQASRDASTHIVRTNVDRQWHRPSTPLPEVVWGIRNNVNLQQSALLIALHEVAVQREEFLRNFWEKSKRAVAKATTEGPAAYVLPADDPRPGQQARLLSLLQMQGAEVHRATAEFTVGDVRYPAGSYIIRMDQPYSRAIDMLLDKQYYNPDDPRPYDDVGWTLGPLFNARVDRVEDVAVLRAPMSPLAEIRPAGSVQGSGSAYIIDYNADNTLTAFRFANRDLRIQAAEQGFEAAGRSFRAGSFIIPTRGNPGDLRSRLERAAAEYGFTAYGVSAVPSVATHQVATPRIAVVHTWQRTQDEGWLRVGLDEYGVPYDYISVHEVRDNPRLRERYDVLLIGPTSFDALSVVRGVTGDKPIPWKRTAVTPNLGRQDETDDMRGGLELRGVQNLQRFVEEGGTLVTLTNSASLPVHFGFVPGLSIRQTQNLWAPGGVYRAVAAEKTSPLLYGYDDHVGVYFNQRSSPVFGTQQNEFARFFGGGGSSANAEQAAREGATTARRSGRGGIDEQDIVQGRPRDMGASGVEAFRAQQQDEESEAVFFGFGQERPAYRTIMRYEPDVSKLLISGGLNHGRELANTPALVQASLGRGNVVMFSFNPFWRGETLGTYAMVFNALMHHQALGIAAPATVADDQ
jgi:hypothetical protein